MKWPKCSCGHAANDHNRLPRKIELTEDEKRDSRLIPATSAGCDCCNCISYDGHLRVLSK